VRILLFGANSVDLGKALDWGVLVQEVEEEWEEKKFFFNL